MRGGTICVHLLLPTLACAAITATSQERPAASSAPMEQWRLAVAEGDSAALLHMFVTSPPPQIKSADEKPIAVEDEVNFWAGWKAKGLSDVRVEIAQEQDPQPKVHVVVAQVVMSVKTDGGSRHTTWGWRKPGRRWGKPGGLFT